MKTTTYPILELMQVVTFNDIFVEYCFMNTEPPYQMIQGYRVCLN